MKAMIVPESFNFSGTLPNRLKGFQSSSIDVRADVTGLRCDIYTHPDGRVAEVWYDGAISYFRIWESGNYRQLVARSVAQRDPEANGNRFFPSDYKRLQITHKNVRSDVSMTGFQHSPRCDCRGCGEVVSYYDAKYGWEDGKYYPFCPKCEVK